MRRQHVALRPGGRDRPVAVARPSAARDARPHALSPHRRASLLVTLAPYGFFWFQLREEAEPAAEASHDPAGVLHAGDGRRMALAARRARTRWASNARCCPCSCRAGAGSATREARLPAATLHAGIPLHDGDPGTMLAIFDVSTGRGQSRYAIPLGVKWSRFDKIATPANILAAVRRFSREGTLVDVSSDPEFMALVLRKIHAGDTVQSRRPPCRVPPDQGLRRHAGTRVRSRQAGRPRAVEHHDHRRQQVRREDAAPAAARRAPRSRDRAFPHRHRAIPAGRASPRLGGAAGGRHRHGARGRPRLHREPGRCLDRHQRLSRPLRRRPAGSQSRGSRPAASSLHRICTACATSDGAPPNCRMRLRAAPTSRPSRPSRSRRRISPPGPTRSRAAPKPRSTSCRAGCRSSTRRPAASPKACCAPPPMTSWPASALSCRPTLRPVKIRHHGDLPPRSDPVRQGRGLHPRFRGRAAAQHGGAPAQGAGRARRRRPAPLDRLCGRSRVRARAGNLARRACRVSPVALDDWRRQAVDTFMAGYREALTQPAAIVAGRPGRGPASARFLLAGQRDLRNHLRAGEPSELVARSPSGGATNSDRERQCHDGAILTGSPGRHRRLSCQSRIEYPRARTTSTTSGWCGSSCRTPSGSRSSRIGHETGASARPRCRPVRRAGRRRRRSLSAARAVRIGRGRAGGRLIASRRSSSDLDVYLLSEGTHLTALREARRPSDDARWRRRRRASWCSPPMPAVSAWSATSISGTAVVTRCACAATASGKSSSPARASATSYKYEVLGPDGLLPLKSDPVAFAAEIRPSTASIVIDIKAISRPHAALA